MLTSTLQVASARCICSGSLFFTWRYLPCQDRDSVVGSVTCYKSDVSGFEPHKGKEFCVLQNLSPSSSQNAHRGSLPGESDRGMVLATHLLLAPRWALSSTITLLPYM